MYLCGFSGIWFQSDGLSDLKKKKKGKLNHLCFFKTSSGIYAWEKLMLRSDLKCDGIMWEAQSGAQC